MWTTIKKSLRGLKERYFIEAEGWNTQRRTIQPLPARDAATVPFRMWKADPEQDRGLFEDLNPTTVIPKVPAQKPPAPHGIYGFTQLANAYNDVDAKCKAAKLLLHGNLEAALAGLHAYAAAHPVAV